MTTEPEQASGGGDGLGHSPVSVDPLRLLVQSVQDYAIFLLDPVGRVVSWNAGAERLKGYAAEEIIGEHFSRFYLPEDVQRHHPGQVLEIARRAGRYEEEGWRVRKDGSRFWANVVVTALYEAGTFVGFAKITRDFTERRRAEADARHLLVAEAAQVQAENASARLQRLRSVSEATLSYLSLDQLLPELLYRVRSLLLADLAMVLLVEGEALVVRAATGLQGEVEGGERFPLDKRFADYLASARHPDCTRNFDYSEILKPLLQEKDVRSQFGVPLVVQGKITGFLHVGSFSPRPFTPDDEGLLQVVADRIALGDEYTRLYQAMQEELAERKRTEAALREGEARLAGIIGSAMDAIISIGEDQRIRVFNAAAEQMFRCPASAAIGQPLDRFIPERFRAAHDGYVRGFGETGDTSRSMRTLGTLTAVRADGEEFPIEATISQVVAGGQRFFTVIIRDITQRYEAEQALRDSEARMRSVVDHVLDAIVTIDAHGIVETFNPAAERIFGFRAEEVVGRNVKILMPEPYHSQHDAYLMNYLHSGQARVMGLGREVVGRRKTGSTFPMDLAVSEFQLGGRRFFTGIVRDITEQKQLEGELRQRAAQLAEADQAKDQFLAMLAHELRNPLASLRYALELMRLQKVTDPAQRRNQEIMERQVQHLARLVDDLLDVSRITRGKIHLQKTPLDLVALVSHVVETSRPQVEARRHQLSAVLPSGTIWVEADATRLEQVLGNLLHNAAKYTEPGGQIILALERLEGQVQIRVRDTGIGIDPVILPRLFEVFIQADHTLDRSEGGLGLGLALVKGLVELHGGSVSATSAGPGHGSEFIVSLPACTEEPTVTPGAVESNGDRTGAGKRVLVIEDDADAAQTLVDLLELWGHTARCVHDGPTALVVVPEFRPEVVLLDIGLPGMDGYEVARRLRQTPEAVGAMVVALTGYGQDEDRLRSREAGVDHHLVKPINPQELKRLLGGGTED